MHYWPGLAMATTPLSVSALNSAKEEIKQEQKVNQNKNWINDIAIPFIVKWEGKIKDKDRKSCCL